jgi:hypothetical protein
VFAVDYPDANGIYAAAALFSTNEQKCLIAEKIQVIDHHLARAELEPAFTASVIL